MGSCFLLGRAQPSRLIPLKRYLDMVVSSWWVWRLPAPPATFPLHRLPTSPCQNFTSPSSSSPSSTPRPPGGEQKRNLWPRQGARSWGEFGDHSPQDPLPTWARPRAAVWERKGWRCWGGNAGGWRDGNGCARGVTCSCPAVTYSEVMGRLRDRHCPSGWFCALLGCPGLIPGGEMVVAGSRPRRAASAQLSLPACGWGREGWGKQSHERPPRVPPACLYPGD